MKNQKHHGSERKWSMQSDMNFQKNESEKLIQKLTHLKQELIDFIRICRSQLH